jgi:hypothetical protein
MRPVVVGRKNWIHVGSEQAGPKGGSHTDCNRKLPPPQVTRPRLPEWNSAGHQPPYPARRPMHSCRLGRFPRLIHRLASRYAVNPALGQTLTFKAVASHLVKAVALLGRRRLSQLQNYLQFREPAETPRKVSVNSNTTFIAPKGFALPYCRSGWVGPEEPRIQLVCDRSVHCPVSSH